MMADVVVVDIADGIATVTMNRPESRNALSSELLRALPLALRDCNANGNFMPTDEAFHFGLVNRVVPHKELLPTARRLAADIAGNDQESVRELLRSYKLVAGTTVDDGMRIEQETARGWQGRRFDPAEV